MTGTGRAATLFTRIGLVALAGLLAWHVIGFSWIAMKAIGYPFELDYGEGIVWFQMDQLFAGDAFGDINRFGGIVFHYTPVYHFATGLVERLGIDALAAGRIVSLLSTAAMVVLIGAITRFALVRSGYGARAATIAAIFAGLTLVLCFPVKVWAPLMRVDMLAFALSLGGVLCGLKAIERPKLIYPAAALFVLAVYTKQTMIAAPAALFLVLLLYRPATAIRGILTCLLLGGAALAALAVATDGGFLRHIFLYNVNRYDPEKFGWLWLIGFGHAMLLFAALAGVAVSCAAAKRFLTKRRDADTGEVVSAILILYFLLTTLSLLLILKSGSGVNYFIEWMAVLAIFAGIALVGAIERALGSGREIGRLPAFAGTVAIIALALQAVSSSPARYPERAFTDRVAGLTKLTERVRAADKPVVSDDMVLLMRAGKPVVWEPAIFAELGSNGVWDERWFVRMIEEKRFAFFVTNQVRGGNLFRQRYNPAVADAIDKAYPRHEQIVGLTIHLPE